MMKRYLFFFLLSLAMMANATPVKKDVAAQKAKAFLKARHGLESPSLSLAMQGRQKTIGMGTAVTDPYYYVFNKGNNEGFIIIAGDDCAAEVLGYVDSGNFDPADMPPNLKEMLDAYAEEIAWARVNVKSSGTEMPQLARQVVTPLIATKWGQDNPYNIYCFTLNGQQAVTGCVATALAQIMYYHKWPKSSTTEIPRYTNKEQGATDDDYYPALPPITFDWDNMQTSYTGDETSDDPKAIAVAQLLSYCGHAAKMSYGRGASGATMYDCIPALTDYFGYANTPVMIQRSCYTKDAWEEIIYNELHHKRPVMFLAYPSYGSGHSFVCDGYDGEGYFHINWGWEGVYDGYFRLEALNPYSQFKGETGVTVTGGSAGYLGYSYRQSALVGISPTVLDEEGNLASDIPRVKVETFQLVDETSNTFDYTGGYLPSIKVKYSFSVSQTGKYGMGYGLYQGENLIDQNSISNSTSLTSAYSLTYSNLSLYNIGRNLADGTYQIKTLCKPDGESQWYKNDDADYKYIEVVVADGKATYTSKVVYPTLKVLDVKQQCKGQSKKQLRVTMKNIGEANMIGIQYLLINDTIYSRENVYIEPGDVDYVDFVFDYSNTAPVTLKVASSTTSNVIYEDDHFQFTNTSSQPYPEVLAKEIRFLDSANKKIYGKVVEAAFTLRNNTDTDYSGGIQLDIQKSIGGGWWSNWSVCGDAEVKAGETKVVTLKCYDLDYGDKVHLIASCAGQKVSATGPYTITPGVFEWDGNGQPTVKALDSSVTVSEDAAAVSFEGLDLTDKTITPNRNPNTIYYLDAGAATPSSLTGKNVVKGLKAAGAIHLTEGHPYYVPYTFDVDGTVDYSFTPSKACDGNTGWQTLTLPFAVTTAKANENAKEWNRKNQDDGKDFWVREYGYVEDGTAYFHNASEWIASEPYLIGVPASLKNASWVLSATATKLFNSVENTMLGSGYRFVGATGEKNENVAYMLNDKGDAFVKTTAASILPGDAYFLATGTTNLPERILIARNGLIGDVNGDGEVNVSDVSILVDYILNKTTSFFIMANADANGDNSITIADVTSVVNIILKIEN